MLYIIILGWPNQCEFLVKQLNKKGVLYPFFLQNSEMAAFLQTSLQTLQIRKSGKCSFTFPLSLQEKLANVLHDPCLRLEGKHNTVQSE